METTNLWYLALLAYVISIYVIATFTMINILHHMETEHIKATGGPLMLWEKGITGAIFIFAPVIACFVSIGVVFHFLSRIAYLTVTEIETSDPDEKTESDDSSYTCCKIHRAEEEENNSDGREDRNNCPERH